jgi:hypothetical protein
MVAATKYRLYIQYCRARERVQIYFFFERWIFPRGKLVLPPFLHRLIEANRRQSIVYTSVKFCMNLRWAFQQSRYAPAIVLMI